jgi:hypothetical protein
MNPYQTPLSKPAQPASLTVGQKRFSFFRALALLLTVYSAAVWYATELVFDWGAKIVAWRAEYFGEDGIPSGSMKFRGPEGKLISLVTFPWSLLVYPAALLAFVLLARLCFEDTRNSHKITHALCALTMAAILARFFYLGIFIVVLSS